MAKCLAEHCTSHEIRRSAVRGRGGGIWVFRHFFSDRNFFSGKILTIMGYESSSYVTELTYMC